MILGVGTDIVQVSRFNHWQHFPASKLLRVFAEQELADCLSSSGYVPEKLAARFAVKEAFFKALSAMLVAVNKTEKTFTLLTICPQVWIEKGTWEVPVVRVNWDFFQTLVGGGLPLARVAVSFSHERNYAVAFVVISYLE